MTQLAFHSDGVGTESNKFLRTLGGAFGYGLSEDICSLYAMLVRSYEDSDNIFLFGFSRGAFTVRSLAGMIHHIGILKNMFMTDDELTDAVMQAYIAYRKNIDYACPSEKIHSSRKIKFIGVWDTVDAIGVPFDALREFVYLAATTRFTRHKDELNASIENAYHAISIDDERHTFHPRIWKEEGFTGKVEQVWFTGVHSNVGGGYPKDSLSYISLDWMMKKANECGLKFLDSKWDLLNDNGRCGDYQEQADRNGRIYDSRSGFAMYYRYSPRKIQSLWAKENPKTLPKIHESALIRVKSKNTAYAPTALPEKFKAVHTWSLDTKESSFKLDLGNAWACIRKRILLYHTFIISTIAFVIAGSFMDGKNLNESILPVALTSNLPSFVSDWLNNFTKHPLIFGAFFTLFITLYLLHLKYKKNTKQFADKTWNEVNFNKED